MSPTAQPEQTRKASNTSSRADREKTAATAEPKAAAKPETVKDLSESRGFFIEIGGKPA